MKKTKVSILCSTYNHKKFIGQALDSFLMQKTNFDFEVLVHDDASTDGTAEIVKKYQLKYSDIIKPIYQTENQFSKGNKRIITKFLFPKAKGKYIALCEGDDFFIDKNKLQAQADFLDSNPEYSLCFHQVKIFFENNEETESVSPDTKKYKNFSLIELIRGNYIHTNSVMYRKQKYTDFPETKFLPGDWYLHMYHAQFGKIGFINKVMSAYRRHSGGLWWSSYGNYESFVQKFGVEHLTMYVEAVALFGKNIKYKNILISNFINLLNYYNKLSIETNESLKLKVKDDTILKIQKENSSLQRKNTSLKNTLDLIKSSNFFKLWQQYCNLKKIVKKLNEKK